MNVIRSELETRLKTFADNYIPKLSVAWEGINLPKPNPLVPYLEVYLIPESTKDVTTDGTRKRQRGCFMVNIWYPVDGKGSKGSDDIAAALVAAFPLVPKTGNVSIEQTPNASRPISDISGWRITPVTITYRYES